MNFVTFCLKQEWIWAQINKDWLIEIARAENAWFYFDATGELPVVQGIHPQTNKFAMGVENEATGNSKLNNSSDTVTDAVKIFERYRKTHKRLREWVPRVSKSDSLK